MRNQFDNKDIYIKRSYVFFKYCVLAINLLNYTIKNLLVFTSHYVCLLFFIIFHYRSNLPDGAGTSKRQWLKGQISSYLSKSKTTENLSTVTTTADQSMTSSSSSTISKDDNNTKTLQNAQSAPDVNNVVAPTISNGNENELNHNSKNTSPESKPKGNNKVNNNTNGGGPILQTVCSDESHLSLMPQTSESPTSTTVTTPSSSYSSSLKSVDGVDKGNGLFSSTTKSSPKNINNKDSKSTSKATKDIEKKPKLSFFHHHHHHKHDTSSISMSTTSNTTTKSTKSRVSLSELLHSQRSPTSPGVSPDVVGSGERSKKSSDNPLFGKAPSSIVKSSMAAVPGVLPNSENLV